MKNENHPSASHLLINQIGFESAREALFGPRTNDKVPGKKAIQQACWKRTFPARWYLVLKEECDKRGIDCPEELFNFLPPSDGGPQ